MGPRSRDRGNRERTIFVTGQVAVQMIASMGPRSRDRGNAWADSPHGQSGMLQWGRDPGIAEIRSDGRRHTCTRQRFNGAAIPGSRKLRTKSLRERQSTIASMGPRSRDRGNARAHGHWSRANCSASMGPRSRDRGNYAGLPRPRLAHAASMGPRSRDRGNVQTGQLCSVTALQWGRDPGIAEI